MTERAFLKLKRSDAPQLPRIVDELHAMHSLHCAWQQCDLRRVACDACSCCCIPGLPVYSTRAHAQRGILIEFCVILLVLLFFCFCFFHRCHVELRFGSKRFTRCVTGGGSGVSLACTGAFCFGRAGVRAPREVPQGPDSRRGNRFFFSADLLLLPRVG